MSILACNLTCKTTVNAKPCEWDDRIRSLWDAKVAPMFEPDERCTSANFHTTQPWRNSARYSDRTE